MSTVEPTDVVGPEATALAAATAKVAHGGVQHDDNAPEQSDMLRTRVAVVDAMVPRKVAVADDRPMIYRRYFDPAAVPPPVTSEDDTMTYSPPVTVDYAAPDADRDPLRPRDRIGDAAAGRYDP